MLKYGPITLLFLVVSAGCGGDKSGADPETGGTGGRDASAEAQAGAPGAGGTGGNNDAGSDASIDGASDGGGGSAGSDGGGDGGVDEAPCSAAPDEPSQFTPGARLSDADVEASFTAISAILKARAKLTEGQAKAEGIRAAVRAAPRVASTAIAPDCTVIVRLSDGTPLSIYDDSALAPLDAGVQQAEVLHSEVQPRALAAVAPSSVALPGSDEVLLGTMFDPVAFEAVTAIFRKRGYEPKLGMTSSDLRDKVVNLGVLWVQTHSSHACEDTKGNKHYCLVTGDPEQLGTIKKCTLNDAAKCAANDLDVREDRASYAMNSEGTKNTFSINEAFVMRYWSFAPNSLVYIDSCGSMRRLPLASSLGWNGYVLRDAIVAKRAGTLLGWSNTVGTDFSNRTALFFFHRVLGGDETHLPANVQSWKLTPRQRPFSVPEVKAVLHDKGMDREAPRQGNRLGSYLVMEQYSEAATILAPSLRNVTIDDPASASTVKEKKTNTELHLFGQFGTKKGVVRVNDSPVVLKGDAWDSTKLVVLIPSSGATAGGPVRVDVVPASRTIRSNLVPLTSWRGRARVKVTFKTFGAPGPFSELNCSGLHYRGDIHPFRMAPEEEARAGTADSTGNFRSQIDFPNSAGGTLCGASIGGGYTSPALSATFNARTQATVPWIVNETLAYPAHPGWWFIASGKIDTSAANAFTFMVASKACTSAVFHYPPPLGDIPVPEICLTVAPASFGPLAPRPLVPITFKMLQAPAVKFSTPTRDEAEVEYDLNAEFPPTPQTEG